MPGPTGGRRSKDTERGGGGGGGGGGGPTETPPPPSPPTPHTPPPRRTRTSTTFCTQDQSESCRSIGAPSTMWRRHPFITSESCVHRRTRFRGTLFSHNWAMGGSAYNRRTVTLRDRYSSGLMSTRL